MKLKFLGIALLATISWCSSVNADEVVYEYGFGTTEWNAYVDARKNMTKHFPNVQDIRWDNCVPWQGGNWRCSLTGRVN